MNPSYRTPVLFLVFNRPEPTLKVFEAIRQSQPERIYGYKFERRKDDVKNSHHG